MHWIDGRFNAISGSREHQPRKERDNVTANQWYRSRLRCHGFRTGSAAPVGSSARYNRLFADGVLWIARVGKPPHPQSFERAHADKAHRVDAMTSSALPNPVALRPTWKGNLIFLLVVAVVVLAVAS